ncbi:MAG: hypothetical protein J0H40_09300 [Rhizobiales bacterium]|nr:hypothetical protein [Hyphomicrobiales bacterium]
MTSKIVRHSGVLLLAAAASFALTSASWAQWAGVVDAPSPPVESTASSDGPNGDAADSLTDWSQLNTDGFALSKDAFPQQHSKAQSAPSAGLAWSSHDNTDGSAALTVKQSVSPLWDTRIGADMTVVRQSSPLTASDLVTDKLGIDGHPSQSSGTAWAAATAPGLGSIWDKTAIEARIDPAQDQTKFGTSLSKSLPFDGGQYALTLQSGYNVIEQSPLPIPGIAGHFGRSYGTDQSARLNIADTGTSLIAGQSLSSSDDKWLRTIGAEQKLFDGVSIAGSISETALGPLNTSLTAAFKRTW